jgi:hypothetical protein
MRIALGLAAAAMLVATGCTPPPNGTANGPGPAGDRVEGNVAVVGSAPMNVRVTVQPDDGPGVYVVGSLVQEIRQLGGVRVALSGRRTGGEFQATDYEVISVDGRPAVMGVVERAADGGVQLRLKDGTLVRLGGATANLPVGRKVWVQGPETVQVQTYGIIEP